MARPESFGPGTGAVAEGLAAPRGRAVLAGIVFLAAALRLWRLGEALPLGDEYLQIYGALRAETFQEFLAWVRGVAHHVLLDPLSTFVLSRAGDGLGWLRLPSVLWGTLAILGIWRLGLENGSRSRSAIAAFLLSVSLMHIDWSRRVDFYSLLALLAAIQTILLFRLIEAPERWGRYGIAAAVFLYAHPYAVLVAALHGLFLAWDRDAAARRARGAYLRAWGAALLGFSPWFVYSFYGVFLPSGSYYEAKATINVWEFLGTAPLFLAQGTDTISSHGGWENSWLSLAAKLYGLLYIISLAGVWRGEGDRAARFSHLAVVFGIVSVTVVNLVSRFYFSPRQLIWILPFYLLAVADGFCLLLDWAARRRTSALRLAATAATAGLVVLAFWPVYTEMIGAQTRSMRGLESLVDSVARAARPGDLFVFDEAAHAQEFLYHYDREAFRQAPAFRSLPQGLTVQRGGARNEVIIAAAGGIERRQAGRCGDSWRFAGEVHDLYVYPPIRCPKKAAARRN